MKPDTERQIDQLVMLAKELASEVETLKAESDKDQVHIKQAGAIDFYDEVERYELISNALDQCGGNQRQAAKLLQLKSTTLHAKMKHYGIKDFVATKGTKIPNVIRVK